MEFVFLSAHKVFGIVKKDDEPDVVLFQGTDPKMTVSITSDLDKHWHILDRHGALATMMLRGLLNQPLPGEFQDNLAHQIAAARKRRSDALGIDGLLVIEIRGELDVTLKAPREIDDYVLCVNAYDKQELHLKLQPHVSSVLAALSMAGSGGYQFERIASGSYVITSDGKILHSFSPRLAAASVYASYALTDEQAALMKENIGLVLNSGDLGRVIRLHAQSLDRTTDNFRAFVSAWSALEILIGKIFPIYQEKLFSDLEKVSAAPGLRVYLERMTDVMNDKHSLADKFAVISIFLDDRQSPTEIEEFVRLKKTRDLLSHGGRTPDGSLPTKDVQRLFEKYFRNHVLGSA